MDQNSSNDTEKRNWRERLGIGGKELPRLSGEFSRAPETIPFEEKAEVKLAQPVAKPAPMAPRVARPQQQMPPPGASPQAPDVLAEKLRAQRAAAEQLAEQRVTAAKQRAENAPVAAPTIVTIKPDVTIKPEAPPAAKPKFTFADDEAKSDFNRDSRALPPGRPPQRPVSQQPQLSPPRPPLGGQSRLPAGGPQASFQPQYRPQPPRSYSPSSYTPPPLQQPQRSFTGSLSQPPATEPRLQAPRTKPDAFRRAPPDDLGYAGAGYENPQRSLQRPGALRAQPQAYDQDYGDEMFEDAPPPRSSRRASATDYNQAYRETEGAYGDERRRSSGPWLMLLFLMLAAGAAGAGVWYYQTKVKTVAASVSTDSAPVVAAPEQAAKSAPEQPLDGPADAAGSAASKKHIYDRIIGDNEVLGGQVVPTEETPILPESQQGDAEQIPQPAGSLDSLSESGEALPLPLPPPPGTNNDTQGSLATPPANKTVALTSPPAATNSTGLAADSEIAPVPGENAAAATTTEQAAPPAATAPAKEEIVNVDPETIVKKPVLKKTKTTAENSLGAAPVVLVPPSDSVGTDQNAAAPPVVEQPIAPQPAPVVKKKKTLIGLLRGTNDQEPAAAQTPAATPVVPEQEVVAAFPQTAPAQEQAAPTQVASAGSGYFVQLASFKSQAEANAEFGRLKSKHAGILGTLPSAINPATVSGSTRYRLALGPLASRDQATKICSSLIAAGERDCLVRKQ
ncbi:MAG TPA: SPOR domain-containing protein [Aestuariivirga sp.]